MNVVNNMLYHILINDIHPQSLIITSNSNIRIRQKNPIANNIPKWNLHSHNNKHSGMLNTEFGSIKPSIVYYITILKQQPKPKCILCYQEKPSYPHSSMGLNNAQKNLVEPCLLPGSGVDMHHMNLNII